MRVCITLLVSVLVFSGCASVKEREMAALVKELGLDTAPYFPKCLSEEVSPRAAMRSGDYSVFIRSTTRRAMSLSIGVRDGRPMSLPASRKTNPKNSF